MVTTDDFRYGIWYYNAKQLKAYADANNIPVLAEFSDVKCDPCIDFKNKTFYNAEFQQQIKQKKCLLCRIDSEGNFTTPGSQENFISHEWGSPTTLIPQLIYYWKQNDETTTKVIWNYNYRTDPVNSNYQTVLNKVDEYFKTYVSDDKYNPIVPTQHEAEQTGHIWLSYSNQPNDSYGRYFAVDSREQVTSYSDSEIIISGTILPMIEAGAPAPIPDGTYCYYTSTDAFYDKTGVMFKVAGGSVAWIFTFKNECRSSAQARSRSTGVSTGTWYSFNSTTSAEDFNKTIGECQASSIPLVIAEMSDDSSSQSFKSSILDSSQFTAWMKTSPCVFMMVTAQGNDWSQNALKAFADFKQSTQFDGDTTTMPGFLVYHGCSSCSVDGKLEVYAKTRVAGKDHDVDYYIDLVNSLV